VTDRTFGDHVTWLYVDLNTLDLGESFDNVLPFPLLRIAVDIG
jgi:hypothetical protein